MSTAKELGERIKAWVSPFEKMPSATSWQDICGWVDTLVSLAPAEQAAGASNLTLVQAFNDMLAASPQPPATHKGAMTEEQIAEACGWKAGMGCKPLPRELQIARAIEQFHGIGIPKESEHG